MNEDSNFAAEGGAEGDTRKQQFIRLACLIVAGGSIAYLLAMPWLAEGSPTRAIVPVLASLVCLAATVLEKRIGTHAAGIIISYGLCATALIGGFIGGGIRTTPIYSLLIVVGMAGWLAGSRHAILIAGISIVATLGITLTGQAATLPPPPARPYAAWFGLAILLAIAAILSRIVTRAFKTQLARVENLSRKLARQVQEIKADEAQLRLVAENMPAMVIHTRNRRCVYANSQYAAFVGLTQQEIVGKHARELMGESDYAKYRHYLDRAAAGERVSYRRLLRRPDWPDAVIDVSLVPERDDSGNVVGMFTLIHDLTDQLRRETALRLSEDKFSKVFSASPLAIAISRLPDGRYLEVNAAWCRLQGWSREEAIGRTSLELGVWQDPQQRQAWARTMLDTGRVSNLDVRFKAKDGSFRDVLLSSERAVLEDEQCALVMTTDVTERRQAEAAQRESQERFAKIFSASPITILITSKETGRYLDVNESFTRQFGWARQEVVGRCSLDIGIWPSAEDRGRWIDALTRHGTVRDYETGLLNRSGELRQTIVSAETIEIGGESCIISLIHDITDRKRAEADRRRSEERFSLIFRSSPEAVALSSEADGRYLDVNDAFTTLFGWSREEAIGKTALELGLWAEPKDRTRWIEALKSSGTARDFEAAFRKKDGDLRSVLVSAGLIDLLGERWILSFCFDITERKRTEEALKTSQTRLTEAQRIGHIGSWELNLASMRLHWSDELYKIYECDPATFGGTWDALLKMVHPDDMSAIRTGFRESAEAMGTYEIVHRIIAPSGRIKHLHVSWEVFFDDTGRPARALGTAQDITEQTLARAEIQRLNAELEQRVQERTAELTAANRELESFAYSISHDLRAPLRGIDGFSKLLTDEYRERLDEQGIDYLDRVRRAAQRMGTLIDDILELSRVTRQEMRRVRVDLSQIAAEIIEERSRAEPDHRVAVTLAPDCMAHGDPQLLRVLMQNLLENAWKYSAKQAAPSIEFGRETCNGETANFVRDNGVGFDMKYADRLFTPFQRLHRPEEFEGTGIGLATVARIARRHGGRVWAQAELGAGTTVWFTLPKGERTG